MVANKLLPLVTTYKHYIHQLKFYKFKIKLEKRTDYSLFVFIGYNMQIYKNIEDVFY
uniref:Uncharacterized protein n=1 Tax=Podoviridae sp. ctQyH19 TaxID=2825249 RepID=A0A8S5UR39_9CAUD|nr:MAG TPA: hypothetical protein [Podoviridae sp. ctQyH19]